MQIGPLKISRRRLLQTAGATGLLGVAGTAWVFTGSRQAYVEGVIRHLVTDAPLEAAGVEEFVANYLAQVNSDEIGKIDKLVKLARLAGVSGTDSILDDWRPYDYFRRRLVTNYLISSDYFDRPSTDHSVQFLGARNACPNPFARFD